MQPTITARNSSQPGSPVELPASDCMSHSAAAPEVTITPTLKTRAAIRRFATTWATTAPVAQIRTACPGGMTAAPRKASTHASKLTSMAPPSRSRWTG